MKNIQNFKVLTKKEQGAIRAASQQNNCIQFGDRCCFPAAPGISLFECVIGGICTGSGRCILPVA
ncbi:hypothetical protein J8281_11245 [Aquimarina sp. U1-2]|uniref:hypothetical protein n=1 Tax=Aquimarina sp. U1-2 TaxID=2823141 RepID=UPI001AECD4F4|nr:hypothetical protein [Aquimarina sp. U1-2]MBP2832762.1 hypothetical protein [Aquimarina sp. U1-2]